MQSLSCKVALLSILLAFYVNSQGLPFYFDPMGSIGGSKKLYALVSTGTQYINTGINGTGDTRVYEVCSRVNTTISFSFGSRNNSVSGLFLFAFLASFRSDYNTTSTTGGTTQTNTYYTIDMNRNVCNVYNPDGSTNAILTTTYASFTNSNPIYVFAGTEKGGDPVSRGSFKKKLFRIYRNDILLFDGIPVPAGDTQYSSTPAPSNCMFDNVSKTYFVNQGTGSFGIEEVK